MRVVSQVRWIVCARAIAPTVQGPLDLFQRKERGGKGNAYVVDRALMMVRGAIHYLDSWEGLP